MKRNMCTLQPAEKKQRNSSFELLRIICMLLIVAHHYVVHTEGLLGGGSTAENTFLTIFGMYGKVANYIFMLITGYFSITAKISYRRILEILMTMNAYYWGIVVFYLLKEGWGTYYCNLHNLFPVIWGNGFVVAYIWFSLLIPLLNRLLNSLDKPVFLRLVVMLFLIRLVPPTAETSLEMSYVESFAVLYCIGAYLRLYVPVGEKISRLWYFPCMFFAFAWLANIPMFWFGLSGTGLARIFKAAVAGVLLGQSGWLVAVTALSFFLVFRNWDFYSPAINSMARCVMGIYLIHDNNVLRAKIWGSVSPGTQWLGTKWLLPHAVIKTLAVFLVCLLVDAVRILIFEKVVDPLLDRWWARSRLARILEKEI